jgi:chromate transporter
MKMKVNLGLLFWKFFKIGLFTFGGGFAMIPLMEREIIKNKWITHEDITDIVAISQSIPGAVAVNMSLFVGYRINKKIGAIVAVLGCITPSIILIILIASLFTQIQDYEIIQNGFTGVLIAVVALIIVSAVKVGKAAIMDGITFLITSFTLGALLLFQSVSPIFYIIGGAFTGLLLYFVFPQKIKQLQAKVGGKK